VFATSERSASLMHFPRIVRNVEKEETTVKTFQIFKDVLTGTIITLVTAGTMPAFALPAASTEVARADEVQAPRGQEVQAPRGQEVQAPRGQEVQAPRADEVQAPRGQEVQAPREDEVQAPRGQGK
jgi:hypothetical protein